MHPKSWALRFAPQVWTLEFDHANVFKRFTTLEFRTLKRSLGITNYWRRSATHGFVSNRKNWSFFFLLNVIICHHAKTDPEPNLLLMASSSNNELLEGVKLPSLIRPKVKKMRYFFLDWYIIISWSLIFRISSSKFFFFFPTPTLSCKMHFVELTNK